jgi:hypothetical protein
MWFMTSTTYELYQVIIWAQNMTLVSGIIIMQCQRGIIKDRLRFIELHTSIRSVVLFVTLYICAKTTSLAFYYCTRVTRPCHYPHLFKLSLTIRSIVELEDIYVYTAAKVARAPAS